MARPTADKKSVYAIISEQILSQLEKGAIPWRKPWKCRGGQRNVRGNAYRGINQLYLSCLAMDRGYESNIWLTFNQAKAAGGSVKKGEKGTPVVFWMPVKKNEKQADGSDKDSSFLILRYYTVFHISQCEGVKVVTSDAPALDPLEDCEAIVKGMKNPPQMDNAGGDRACYVPAKDTVHMPVKDSFCDAEHYYNVLFHELGHSTGHASRLNRKGVSDSQSFGSHEYGLEELVAEFTAAFLCGHAGIAPNTVENSAAYIDHWKKAIKVDEKMVVMAAAQAQKAADYVLGDGKDEEESEDTAAAA